MDAYETIAVTAAITTVVGGIVGAVVSSLVAAFKTSAHKASDEDRAMRSGMRALLWREIKNIHAEAMRNGGLTIADRRHLESVYGAYHGGLDGNGTGTRLFEEAMEQPVLDE